MAKTAKKDKAGTFEERKAEALAEHYRWRAAMAAKGTKAPAAARSEAASIYVLVDPRTRSIRYVGKAKNPAARLKGHVRASVSSSKRLPVADWIRSLAKSGLEPEMVIAVESVGNWQFAERHTIKTLREVYGCDLLNVAAGGNEPHCPQETRDKNAVALKAWTAAFNETRRG